MIPDHTPATGFVTDYLLFVFFAVSLTYIARRLGHQIHSRWPMRAVAVLAVVAWVALAGETWFRFVADVPTPGSETLIGRRWDSEHMRPELDALGLRGTERPPENVMGVPRVLLLGDDIVAGSGIADADERVGARLAAALSEQSPAPTIWQVGKPGWTTGDQLAFLEDEVGVDAVDRVILLYRPNDVLDLVHPDNGPDLLERPSWIGLTRSFLADTLWFRSVYEGRPYLRRMQEAHGDPAVFSDVRQRFARISDHCRRIGAQLDIVFVPEPAVVDDVPDGLVDLVLLTARNAGADAYDATEAVTAVAADDRVVSDTALEPSAATHRALAEFLETRLFSR